MLAGAVYLSLERDVCRGLDLVILYSCCTVLFSAASHAVASVCECSLSEREVLSWQSGCHPQEVEHH